MIGEILKFYGSGLLYTNADKYLKAAYKGTEFNADLGMLGKGINKISKGKIPVDLGLVGKTGISNALIRYGLGSAAWYMFSIEAQAIKTVASLAYQQRRKQIDEEIKNNIVYNSDDNKYYGREDYQVLSTNSYASLERSNFEINRLLSKENLATKMLYK